MHFWIDKRSQAFGYNGRQRVSASLASGPASFGFGHPRRLRGKSMVTPIHRFPTVECARPHLSRQQQSQSQSHQQSSANNSTATTATNTNTSSVQQQQQQQQQSASHQSQISFQQQQQNSNNRHIHNTSTSCGSQHHQQSNQHQNSNYNVQRVYSSHPEQQHVDLDSEMISAISTRPSITMAASGTHETQLLPSHLKLGLWASLALATIFVTSAKFYFDHQGTGLEVLIFCAFSATFFLLACTVSLWKKPTSSRDPLPSTAHTIQTQTEQMATVDPPLPPPMNYDALAAIQAAQPPPPYHIAILLPENSKEMIDESPPPAYDKIVI